MSSLSSQLTSGLFAAWPRHFARDSCGSKDNFSNPLTSLFLSWGLNNCAANVSTPMIEESNF